MYDLYIANKNYSSWSLRPWVLMRTLGIAFDEKLIPFGEGVSFSSFSPTGKVPCLVDEGMTVWETLSIVEYLAERHQSVWASDKHARAWSRSAASEMHAGFSSLRNLYPMSVGIRVKPRGGDAGLKADIKRIDALWSEGLTKFGGPYLAGQKFTAVDAFFCPVAFRFQTYGSADLSPAAKAYCDRLLALPAMQEWYEAGLKESWRDAGHEEEVGGIGELTEDLRAKAR
ncbi:MULTISPECIES: glutathione S-transferase family protein [Agrobacterium]|uniref:glutathione S-transferase family protein n=1 Tax=Agrobacterium TaxID=357 RepID=UPI00277E7805|nr:glutathione S-transferase family protein [Agrobacterium sp. SORGH_AS_0745]MDP9760284.1 glutathione S-transferase [Agrobacterium tumefaciens]MDQ1222433.1 glutathione S-transferase [Agrobacterium sp. SORGH_AS_0745]